MSDEWTKEQVLDGQGNDKTQKWTHGKLGKIKPQWFEWGQTVDGVKQPSTEITYEQYKKLERNDRNQVQGGGEKLTFTIDPTVLNPNLQFVTERSLFRGFPDWARVTAPSIADVVGQAENPLVEFAERAATEEWYVEAELVKVTNKNGKTNEVPRFTFMTKDLDEIRKLAAQRFPKHIKKPSEELVANAKMYFDRMAKRDLTKFHTWVAGDDDAKAFEQELMDLAAGW